MLLKHRRQGSWKASKQNKKVLDKNESDWYNIWAVSKEASEKQKLNLENERLNSV